MTQGKVYLVGAGPGDPGLLTLKGQKALASADVVLYDRLVDGRILAHAADTAELVDVGKVPGKEGRKQAHINRLLIQYARQGKRVVRLQGGDPFVFGRGGEEAEELKVAEVPFEVVPGVTSAVAAPAYAGIPLTHRRLSSAFTVVTGNEDPSKPESSLDWEALARLPGTLVVLMGWRNLPDIVDTLMAHGKPPETPAALVMWGTEPWQNAVSGTLADIVEAGRASEISSPVVAVIGEVASLRDTLRWFDNRPLFGKRVLVTRTRSQASGLLRRLASAGAIAVEVPAIEIQPLEDYSHLDSSLKNLLNYQWVVFSSANAVEAAFSRLDALDLDARALAGVRTACIGPATARALNARGVKADLLPESAVAESLLDSFACLDMPGAKVLMPKADIGRDVLSRGLSDAGAVVDEVVAYRTGVPCGSATKAVQALAEGIDLAVFTSSSTVENLVKLLDGDVEKLTEAAVACIGPVTATTAGGLGIPVDIVASEHTLDGLMHAIENHFSSGGDQG